MSFEIPAKQEKKPIKDAQSIDELLLAIESLEGIQGSKQYFTSEQLRYVIQEVQEGKLDIDYITRADGLRDKLKELLDKEVAQKIKKAQSFEELYKIIESIGGLDGSHRYYSAEELISRINDYKKSGYEIFLKRITGANDLRDKVEELFKNGK